MAFVVRARDVISVYGDSITEFDWCYDLRQRMFAAYAKGQHPLLYKDGAYGIAMSLARTNFAASISARRPKYTKLIVELGTNNYSLGAGGIAAFQTDYGALLDAAVADGLAGASILCIGIMGASNTPNPDVNGLDGYNTKIQTEAARVGANYVDLVTPYRALLAAGGPDPNGGVHPLKPPPANALLTFPAGVLNSPSGTMSGQQYYSRIVQSAVTFG